MAKIKNSKTIDQKIDDLATSVKLGFDDVEKRFSESHRMHQVFVDRFDNLDNEIGQLKMTTKSLVTMVVSRDREMRNLDLRLRRVERRVGLLNN